jgi:hypothetical protein
MCEVLLLSCLIIVRWLLIDNLKLIVLELFLALWAAYLAFWPIKAIYLLLAVTTTHLLLAKVVVIRHLVLAFTQTLKLGE